MNWTIEEAIAYYQTQGAPADQSALISLLREVQQETGGALLPAQLQAIAQQLAVKESYLLAVIKRIPSLRLSNSHVLEICAGPNCGKAAELAAFAESLQSPEITVKFVPCMRLCGKGPNIKWDGQLFHKADRALLKKLTNA